MKCLIFRPDDYARLLAEIGVAELPTKDGPVPFYRDDFGLCQPEEFILLDPPPVDAMPRLCFIADG